MTDIPIILVVDDDHAARATMEGILTGLGHELLTASSGAEALEIARARRPDLVLLDVMMPGMDGFEVCRRIRADSDLTEIPVIMATALDDQDAKLRGLESGADDLVTKPINRAELRARVQTVLRLNRYRKLAKRQAELESALAQLQSAYDQTLAGWGRALDLRDHETEDHTLRVTKLTVALARRLEMTEKQLVEIRRGALLHDIGKVGVPDSILNKPGPLTESEQAVMRTHPRLAYEMLLPIEYLSGSLDIPYCHHERWDGTGYPRGLRGEEIPLNARIFAVADVWDALTSDRPYRKAWDRQRALAYMRANSGSHFDPAAVELFMRVISEPPWAERLSR